MSSKKILSLKELSAKTQALKSKGSVIVLCHGCFDLMHPGHIKYFQAAKKMGDILNPPYLVVCIKLYTRCSIYSCGSDVL